MDDGLEALTVAEIMTRVRDKVRRDVVSPSPMAAGNGFGWTAERRADRAMLESHWDIYDVDVRSPRVGVGVLLTGLKRALRRLLAPTLGRQIGYNAANARVTLALSDQVDLIGRHQARVSEEILSRLAAQDVAIQELRAELESMRAQTVAARGPGERAATDPAGTESHGPCRRP